MKTFFTILRLCRDDLKMNEIKGRFTDAEMQWIATKMGELYCETDFSRTLVELCDEVRNERRKEIRKVMK